MYENDIRNGTMHCIIETFKKKMRGHLLSDKHFPDKVTITTTYKDCVQTLDVEMPREPEILKREPKIVAVDFDGTLCEDAYPEIGKERRETVEYIKRRQKRGDKIILWTCRQGKTLDDAVFWCLDRGLAFDAINENVAENAEKYGSSTRKVYADVYIDDHAISPEEACDEWRARQ